MRLFTIGFTQTSAESFFERLRQAGVRRVVDVRLHNVSQLAGFAKRDDLKYLLKVIGDIDYLHRLELAPTQELLDAYRQRKVPWATYERDFLALIAERRIEATLPREQFEDACLLCSEATAQRCHRRLVADYLQQQWGNLEIVHL
jgi:uncharacterized protein (DUF488 family)